MRGGTDGAERDLTAGVPVEEIPDGGCLRGQAGGEDAILVRRGEVLYAVGAYCTHHHGPLADGLVEGCTIFCPWHQACFDLRTGEAVDAPALDAIPCWRVERVGDVAFVREKL